MNFIKTKSNLILKKNQNGKINQSGYDLIFKRNKEFISKNKLYKNNNNNKLYNKNKNNNANILTDILNIEELIKNNI